MTRRLPFAASTVLTGLGDSGHASPNSVDSVKVASGSLSPLVIMPPRIAEDAARGQPVLLAMAPRGGGEPTAGVRRVAAPRCTQSQNAATAGRRRFSRGAAR